MSMTDTYRALCAEIIDAHDADVGMSVSRWTANLSAVINRARAALAHPEPVAPTDEDVTELFYRHMGEGGEGSGVGFENAIAEALARWGTPANTINQED
jgi:hypothetical protein